MGALFLHNARLIDGNGGPPIADGALLIDDGTIAWAGDRADAPPAPEARHIDVGGNTICPGFFDCHVHFCLPGPGGSMFDRLHQQASYATLLLLDRLRVTLHNGVTTARDLMGVDAGVRRAQAEGLIEGPRLLVAVDMVSQSGGHADFRLPSGIDPSALFHGSRVDSVDDARRRVRDLIDQGADLIKIASSGGVASPSDQPEWLGMREELVHAVVQECQALGGKRVAAHAIGYAGIKAAIEGGVTSIEHGYQLDDELRRRMVDNGTFLVPTLMESMHALSARTLSQAAHDKSVRWHRLAHKAVGISHVAGVKIALGTDSGLSPNHGSNLQELGLLVRIAGLTPMEAIVAGTRTAAELCGLDDRLGTLEAGKLADVVVVRGNPLEDIDSVGVAENILLVLQEGRLAIDRAGFLAGIQGTAAAS